MVAERRVDGFLSVYPEWRRSVAEIQDELEMGGEGKGYGNGTPQPVPISPFFSPLAAHHSAKRDSVERNPLANRKSQVTNLKSQKYVSLPPQKKQKTSL